MDGSAADLVPPDSWEVADLEASVSRLMLSSRKSSSSDSQPLSSSASSASHQVADVSSSSSAASTAAARKPGGHSEDVINSVDQFLREALQNPRERLSVLRMEQDVEKFIRDPTQQQMEFNQLPTSYLRLAAHRVAQHYSLQSMVLLDNNLPDGSGSRIIVRKTSECRQPLIRLAEIPVNLPAEDSGGVVKVAIKQRPNKKSQNSSGSNSHSGRSNSSKSVEERKEEYNRARARIFSSSNPTGNTGGRSESAPRMQSSFQHNLTGAVKAEENSVAGGSDVQIGRGLLDPSSSSSRLTSSRVEKQEPVGAFRTNNRVAIYRDREFDRKDPDYDRSYDRYVQRFDPGFGFNGGAYAVQPMYTPAVNYNTEFPQLGSSHRPLITPEHQPRPVPQHLPGSWIASASGPGGIGYGHPDTLMAPFSSSHVGARSTSGLYLHTAPYPCQRPGMQFIVPHEQVHQHFAQAQQQQHDASFGIARPR